MSSRAEDSIETSAGKEKGNGKKSLKIKRDMTKRCSNRPPPHVSWVIKIEWKEKMRIKLPRKKTGTNELILC